MPGLVDNTVIMNGLDDEPIVLVCGTIVWAHEEIKALSQYAKVLPLESKTRSEFQQDCAPDGKYGQVSVIYRSLHSMSAVGEFDAELVQWLPPSVRFLCHNGAGYDTIDVEACLARGIRVSNTPKSVDDATATTAMFLLLSALRQFWPAQVNARQDRFKTGLIPALDPEGKTLGIVGMGGIGSALARRALGFDMRILYYNRSKLSDAFMAKTFPPHANIQYVDTLEGLLKQSDVVSLNLPLNPKTRGSFSTRAFEAMKDGAILINTARGAIVDQEALIKALDSGKLFAAGLDVFPDEPNIDPRLLNNPRISILPHMGTETRDTQYKMERQVIDNIRSALDHHILPDLVPEHAVSTLVFGR